MLEILAIIQFCKKIGVIMRDKGRSPFWFQLLLVVMWFGGEFVGGFGAVMVTNSTGMMVYLFAIACAIAGAVIAFAIAKSAAPGVTASNRPTGGFPVIQPVQEESATRL